MSRRCCPDASRRRGRSPEAQRAFRHISEVCSLYSGYRAYLNIAAVEPGPYKLDAIVPAADGGRADFALHPSITVVDRMNVAGCYRSSA